MRSPIAVAVIGGTGKSGNYLVQQLINHNISFKILLRAPEKLSTDLRPVAYVKGSVRDYEAVRELIKGTDAIISMLGQPREEAPIFSQATRNILKAMEEHHVQRYIVTTGLNVDAVGDEKSPPIAAATKWMYENYPATTIDKQIEYDLLTKSTIKWTMIRLPLIEQTDISVPIKVSLTDCPGDKINAASLANFAIEQLYDNQFIGKAPFIANG